MTRRAEAQVNIRSTFVRDRSRDWARRSGKTVTEVIEDAMRAYAPADDIAPVGRLRREGRFLVGPAGDGPLTLEGLLAEIRATRDRDED